MAQIFTLPFGAVSSVCTWDAIGGTIQQILSNIFLIGTTRYVDDIILLEWSEEAVETDDFTNAIIEKLLGWNLGKDKAVTASKDCIALGIRIQIQDDKHGPIMSLSIPEAKRDKWALCIRQILESGICSKKCAEQLAGGLSWATPSVFGNVA